jgi:hypothetical protein
MALDPENSSIWDTKISILRAMDRSNEVECIGKQASGLENESIKPFRSRSIGCTIPLLMIVIMEGAILFFHPFLNFLVVI